MFHELIDTDPGKGTMVLLPSVWGGWAIFRGLMGGEITNKYLVFPADRELRWSNAILAHRFKSLKGCDEFQLADPYHESGTLHLSKCALYLPLLRGRLLFLRDGLEKSDDCKAAGLMRVYLVGISHVLESEQRGNYLFSEYMGNIDSKSNNFLCAYMEDHLPDLETAARVHAELIERIR